MNSRLSAARETGKEDSIQDGAALQGDASGAGPSASNGPVVDLVIRSTQIDEMENITSSLISSHTLNPLTRDGAFDSVLQVHGLKDFCGFSISYGRSVAGTLEDDSSDERMAFVMATEGRGQLIINRREFDMSGKDGVVFPAGPLRTLHHDDNCEISVLVMNRRKLADQCAKLLGHEIDRDLQFDPGFDLSGANGQSWVRLFHYATSELANPHSLFRSMAIARQQLEQTVLTGFLLGHTHTYSEALLRPQSAAAPFYVRRAEAFIEAHFAEPLSLADIAAQSGVSARSLQNGFQSFRDMTPMAFLRLVRLKRAQEALLRADPAFATVTQIALSCGFGHLGEFASLYRRTFGEMPRQTLARTLHR